MTIDEISENFAILDEWDDRYRYLIELGRMLPPLPDAARIDANKVQGCASQVWLTTDVAPGPSGPVLRFAGDSDAHIVRGLIAILFAMYSQKPARDILATDALALFDRLGLARASDAAAIQRIEIDGGAHPQRSEPRARRRRGVTAQLEAGFDRFEPDPKVRKPFGSRFTGAAPALLAEAHLLGELGARFGVFRAPPSDNPRRGPISRGNARASCCIACADDA